MIHRSVHAIFCDDIRLEMNGKLSLIGAYTDGMYVEQFPANVMKVCAMVTAVTPVEHLFKEFTITTSFNGVVLGEMSVTEEQMAAHPQPPDAKLQTVQAQLIFSPLNLDKEGELRVVFNSEGQDFLCVPLRVSLPPPGANIIPS